MSSHISYARMTLGDLIGQLEDIGDGQVEGLSGQVHSYRGYYERNATTPSNRVSTGSVLARAYQSVIGNPMFGWKGGDFTVSADELIYYTQEGDTGPSIIGLESDDDGVYRPVLLEHDDYF